LPFDIALLVLVSAASHAGWNFLAKSGTGDALSRSAAILTGAAITGAPFLLFTGLPAEQSLVFALASAVVHAAYMLLVGLVYRGADMSAAYPIIRGGSLILTSLCAALLFSEVLPATAWGGVIVIATGVIAMGIEAIIRKGLDATTFALAFLAAITVTAYTLIDGTGVRLSENPVGYVLTMTSLTGLAAFVAMLAVRPRAVFAIPRETWLRGLAGGALFNLSYGIALFAMTLSPIGLVAAVRETSILFGAALSVLLLHEKFGRWRCIAAFVILAGLVMTRLARG
jgi:drug/metabolite transporter (DMT)-like permease